MWLQGGSKPRLVSGLQVHSDCAVGTLVYHLLGQPLLQVGTMFSVRMLLRKKAECLSQLKTE